MKKTPKYLPEMWRDTAVVLLVSVVDKYAAFQVRKQINQESYEWMCLPNDINVL